MVSEAKPKTEKSSLEVSVLETSSGSPIVNARINLFRLDALETEQTSLVELDSRKWQPPLAYKSALTNAQGRVLFASLAPGKYGVQYAHLPATDERQIVLEAGKRGTLKFEIDFAVVLETMLFGKSGKKKIGLPMVGDTLAIRPDYYFDQKVKAHPLSAAIAASPVAGFPYQLPLQKEGDYEIAFQFDIPLNPSASVSKVVVKGQGAVASQTDGEQFFAHFRVNVKGKAMAYSNQEQDAAAPVNVTMSRTQSYETGDVALWVAIKNSAENLSFEKYSNFIHKLFRSPDSAAGNGRDQVAQVKALKDETIRSIPFANGEAYRLLKVATEAYVLVNCGVVPSSADFQRIEESANAYNAMRDVTTTSDSLEKSFNDYLVPDDNTQPKILPYMALIHRKMPELDLVSASALNKYERELGYQILQQKMDYPCMLELIWSYWHEEGMLVQTMNAITRRFQNVRSPLGNDPLANVEIDPLRPLNNVIWGYTQDEQNRLSVVRRNYEYDHHYGLRLEGKAVQNFRPADSRSKFLEAFHHLLRMCSIFFKQDDDTTVKADAFPVLNALKEVHLILSQGAHNQYGDLPSTARAEMLMQQWMLARPEFRDFLPTRMMVAYPEPWMDRVDAMKKLQGWTDTSVLHFRSLGMFGEQVLLSVRFGSWSDIYEPAQAFNWARFWRPQIQGYIHAYRAVTGVDLTGTAVDTVVDATMPSVLLQRRLDQQLRTA